MSYLKNFYKIFFTESFYWISFKRLDLASICKLTWLCTYVCILLLVNPETHFWSLDFSPILQYCIKHTTRYSGLLCFNSGQKRKKKSFLSCVTAETDLKRPGAKFSNDYISQECLDRFFLCVFADLSLSQAACRGCGWWTYYISGRQCEFSPVPSS